LLDRVLRENPVQKCCSPTLFEVTISPSQYRMLCVDDNGYVCEDGPAWGIHLADVIISKEVVVVHMDPTDNSDTIETEERLRLLVSRTTSEYSSFTAIKNGTLRSVELSFRVLL